MSKKIVQEYLKKGDKINAKVVFDNGKKFKIEVEGDFKSMSNNNSGEFSNKQLEQIAQVVVSTVSPMLKPIVERLDQVDKRLDKVDKRLDNLEKDVKVLKEDVNLIKNTPTMQKELK